VPKATGVAEPLTTGRGKVTRSGRIEKIRLDLRAAKTGPGASSRARQ